MAWTDRYVRQDANGSGDGTTDANSGATGSWTLAQAVTNEVAGMRLNVKYNASAYASTTTVRTLAATGTTTAPVWWRGYNTTIGDCDTDPTLLKPLFTFTTGNLVVSGAHHIVSNINVTSTTNNSATVQMSAVPGTLDRCTVQNSQANAAASAVTLSGSGTVVTRCYCKATTTATIAVQGGTTGYISGCYIEGGITGLSASSGGTFATRNIITGATTAGILCSTTTASRFVGNTIVSCGTNGINFSNVTVVQVVEGNLFSTLTNGVNNTSGANTNFLRLIGNSFYSVTNAVVGLGDSPVLSSITESSNPIVGSGNYALVDGALSRGTAATMPWEGLSGTTSYADRGAVQVDAPTSAATAAAMWTYGNRQLS